MKIFRNLTPFIVLALFIVGTTNGQSKPKNDTITIQTSAVCGMCKDRIEQGLAFEKGIRNVVLDEETKKVKVWYKTTKTTPEKIRIAITKLGYDADTLTADPKAYAKLPACCKKDVAPH